MAMTPAVPWIPRSIGSFAALAGATVLLAWAFDLDWITGPLRGGATMKANTALCFVLAGAALATTAERGVPSGVGSGLALAAVAIALATLAEYAFSWDLRIDQLLVIDADPGSSTPGRMSPMTAVCFAAFGSGILASRTQKWLWLREPLAILALLASALATLGYTYDARALYSVGPYTSMAPHTAVLLTLMSVGLLAQHPAGAGLSAAVLGQDLGGATTRRLLPWALATPMVVGWLKLHGERAGWWGPEFGVALVVIATMVIVSVVVSNNARSLRTSERAERATAAELRELTQTLERRVEEKTQASTQSEARFRALLESAPDAMVITDDAGIIRLANRQAERLFGYSSNEFVGLPVDTLLPPRFRAAHTVHRQSYGATPQPRSMGVGLDLWALNKDGAEFPVEVSLSPLHLQSGLLISSAIRDISWRRELEADRRRFVYLAEQSQDFIGMCDTAFVPFYVNEAGRRLVGLDDLEHARRVTVGDFFFPEDRAFVEQDFFPRVVRDGHGAVEIRFRHFRTGDAVWMNYRVSNLRDERGDILGWATISSDVTTRRQTEAALRTSLGEKETLLREVHHRVKNNLAVIGSLLYLQSTYITDPALRRVLQESQERVRSMALVHERLYQSRDVAQVDFAEYVRELAAELSRNYATAAGSTTLAFDVAHMVMDLDSAALSGLVLNECISNALKHAFPDGRRGTIRIGLRKTTGGFILSVADNGIGLPADVACRQTGSLGMRLMHALASQLDGRIEFHDADPGTEVRLVVEAPDVRG